MSYFSIFQLTFQANLAGLPAGSLGMLAAEIALPAILYIYIRAPSPDPRGETYCTTDCHRSADYALQRKKLCTGETIRDLAHTLKFFLIANSGDSAVGSA